MLRIFLRGAMIVQTQRSLKLLNMIAELNFEMENVSY